MAFLCQPLDVNSHEPEIYSQKTAEYIPECGIYLEESRIHPLMEYLQNRILFPTGKCCSKRVIIIV